ncbi:hypothetical protein [Streptomyces sp. NPDC003327]
MATSNPLLRYAESRKNLAGSACGLVGLAVSLTGAAGSLWPVVVAGLYAAGALIAPPERPPIPDPPTTAEQRDAIGSDLPALRSYLAEVEIPDSAQRLLDGLDELLDALLGPDGTTDPEHLHVLARTIRVDVPEAVDSFVRTRWWSRVAPGAESPERHLERQLTALHRGLVDIASELREEAEVRQRSHTAYTENQRPS